MDSTQVEQKTALGSERHLIFSLGKDQLALRLTSVREVIGNAKTTPLPKAAPFVKGVLNLRGKIVSVVDLRSKLGREKAVDTAETAIIILDQPGDGSIGILVDSVDRVVHFDANHVSSTEAMPPGFSSRMISGIVRVEDQLVLVLNIESALT